MVFSSVLFLFCFLPITLAGYWLVRKGLQNYWLLSLSLLFFAWPQPGYLWIILLDIAVNYLGAICIGRLSRARRAVLAITVILDLGLLFYFKYFDFVMGSVNAAFGTGLPLRGIVLPIGISFFTFQGMSYTIDVYRNEVRAQRDPLKVALYVTLFPQLIAGPIVRYKDIAAEIDDRRVSLDDFAAGIGRFIIGLGKKAIIANTMAACADSIWACGAGDIPCITAWAGSIAYTLQIFFDFSGYSDMAIGLGRMFGFHFMENFNLPYVSKSMTEFWRRWHISLSTWFRDYVYIPLGGNRRHVYLNLAAVFMLTGIWHGASWNFVAWGAYNAAFILAERAIGKWRKAGGGDGGWCREAIRRAYTLLAVDIGWVVFRAPTLGDALLYIGNMSRMVFPARVDFTVWWYLDRWTIFCLVLGAVFSSSAPRRIAGRLRDAMSGGAYLAMKYLLLLGLLLASMLRIVSGTYNPFIYFQF